jgi:hypothetical protein
VFVVGWLDWGVVGAFLELLLVVGLAILGLAWAWGFGGWLEYRDRRDARTREDVEADIAEYGASAVGIRDELLPEDERQLVREARRRAERRWGRKVLH